MEPAVKVHKSDAQQVIKYLRDRDLVNDTFKIAQSGEDVIIPVLGDFSLSSSFPYDTIEYEFELRDAPPSSLQEALEALLPDFDPTNFPSSYDQIGHIAVIDIKDHNLPISNEIGNAIMSSNSTIQTVYRKSSKVQGLYRLRPLELIAGEDVPVTTVKEHGIRIRVDVRHTYFSPRLATEHHRVANSLADGVEVLDLFGSLAPFSLHITRRLNAKCDTVDINPAVIPLIEESVRLNQLKGSITPHCIDAMEFLDNSLTLYDAILMNHPSDSLPYLAKALDNLKADGFLYLYIFVPIDRYDTHISDLLRDYNIRINHIQIVRQSSPSEYHVCVEIRK